MGVSSAGPSPNTCIKRRRPPVRVNESISISTVDGNPWASSASLRARGRLLQISVKVSMHIGLKGSSRCSATAMRERRTASDMGTTAAPLEMDESRRVVPISTIVRMSLIACSFSTAYLISRFSDLLVISRKNPWDGASSNADTNGIKRLTWGYTSQVTCPTFVPTPLLPKRVESNGTRLPYMT